MNAKKAILCAIFIAMLQGAIAPIYSAETVKEGSAQLNKLKKHLLCFKKKEGCSQKEIAAIVATVTGLTVLVGSIIWYGGRKYSLSDTYKQLALYMQGKNKLFAGIRHATNSILKDVPPRVELEEMDFGPERENVANTILYSYEDKTVEDKAYLWLKESNKELARKYVAVLESLEKNGTEMDNPLFVTIQKQWRERVIEKLRRAGFNYEERRVTANKLQEDFLSILQASKYSKQKKELEEYLTPFWD